MKIIISTLCMLIWMCGIAQKPEVRFSFEGIGDNREFHNGQSRAQTILGTLGSAQIGTTIGGNSLFAGISELYEFGSRIDFHQPHLIFYYKYEDQKKNFLFGSFPRLGMIDFPLAMLADTLLYFRPMIEGLAGKINGEWGHQLAFVDWTGRQTQTIRESFMAGSSGEVRLKNWFLQNYFLLNHLAHTFEKVEGQHIKDYFGFLFLTGFRFGNEKSLTGQLKGGLMTSFYRERSVNDGFKTSNSFIMECTGRFRFYAFKTTFHSGEKQRFASGDPLYRFSNYLRVDAIWNFINFKNVKGHFNWSFHVIDWKTVDHSQQLSIIYTL